MRYFLPRLEVTGKRPFWSMEILPVTFMEFNNAILVCTWVYWGGAAGVIISGVLLSMEGVVVILVLAKISLGGCQSLGKMFAENLRC